MIIGRVGCNGKLGNSGHNLLNDKIRCLGSGGMAKLRDERTGDAGKVRRGLPKFYKNKLEICALSEFTEMLTILVMLERVAEGTQGREPEGPGSLRRGCGVQNLNNIFKDIVGISRDD